MNYDIKLHLHYDYARGTGGGRHQIRVVPRNIPGIQRLVASSIDFAPEPAERSDFSDFFGNSVASIAFRSPHDALDIRMTARVAVSRPDHGADASPDLPRLAAQLAEVRSLASDSPHHFLATSEFATVTPDITTYAAISAANHPSVIAIANDFCNRITAGFKYDGDATTVTTKAADAFALKRGVCQDFAHVMIAGLRGLGIPAGYVSGFLRTNPPAGKERLEGADAMHAWVTAWCGVDAGWQEFDPTNAMRGSNDHIVVGYGRDYADVSPIVGFLKTAGGQVGEQAVDVIPVG